MWERKKNTKVKVKGEKKMKTINPSRVFGVMLALLVMIWSFGSVSGYALAAGADNCLVTSQWNTLSTTGCVLLSSQTNAMLLIDLRNADTTLPRDVIVTRVNPEDKAGNCDAIGTVSVPIKNVIKELDECQPSNSSFKMTAANRGYISYRVTQRVDTRR